MLLFIVGLLSCSSPTVVQVEQMIAGQTMGTTYSIKVIPFPGMPSILKVSEAVDQVLGQVNSQMSTYDPGSELSRFNTSTELSWFQVSSETAKVVAEALKFSQLSDGAFDVTAAPLVNLWGFGPPGRINELPTREEIASVMQSVGFEKLAVRLEPPALKKSVAGLQVDLSAIAKGHGVDRVANCLRELGFAGFFVEIGGEVVTAGRKVDGSPWRVGIEKPVEGDRDVQVVLELTGSAVATSGDYRNVFRMKDVRLSHTIDLATGSPVDNSMASASVIASTCMEADAAATTLMAIGFERGMQLADELNWNAFLVSRTADGVRVGCSKKFQEQFPSIAEELMETSQ